MNHIHNKQRNRLKPDTTDHLLRLRVNGPDNINQFPAEKFAGMWLEGECIRCFILYDIVRLKLSITETGRRADNPHSAASKYAKYARETDNLDSDPEDEDGGPVLMTGNLIDEQYQFSKR